MNKSNMMNMPRSKMADETSDRCEQVFVKAQEKLKSAVLIIQHHQRCYIKHLIYQIFSTRSGLKQESRGYKDYIEPNNFPKVNNIDIAVKMARIEDFFRRKWEINKTQLTYVI